MIKHLFTFLFVMISFFASAQEAVSSPQMADTFRQEGKIYVVISVIGIIFLAIVCFLIFIERKLKKLEKEVNHELHK